MENRAGYLNRAVAAVVLLLGVVMASVAAAAPATPTTMPRLLAQLKSNDPSVWKQAESEIWNDWSNSGSPAMNLLLERGRDAIDAGDYTAAIDHLTALIDHAPDFAEAYNARATAYYEAGEFGPALADIATTLKLNPHHFAALAGLGMILEQMGEPKRALAAYKASAAIHPHQPAVEKAIKRLELSAAGQEL